MTIQDDLRRLAEAATPGEWESVMPDDPRGQPVPYYSGLVCIVKHDGTGKLSVVTKDGSSVSLAKLPATTRFIAAANPAAIIALCDQLDAQAAENDALRAQVETAETGLMEIHGHLGAAIVQRAPSDDAIIAEHIERADKVALMLIRLTPTGAR